MTRKLRKTTTTKTKASKARHDRKRPKPSQLSGPSRRRRVYTRANGLVSLDPLKELNDMYVKMREALERH